MRTSQTEHETDDIQVTAGEVSRTTKIADLRALLAEKFPRPPVKTGGAIPTGLPGVELRRGVVTEVSGSPGSGALFLEALIDSASAEGMMPALVDGVGGFDPARIRTGTHLLWVMCKQAQPALKVADLLLRDGNLPLVILDLQMNPAEDLRRIPSTAWYRFQRILEQSTAAFTVLTPKAMVSSAAERIELRNRWTLRAMRRRREELRRQLNAECIHRRVLAPEAETAERKIA